MRKMVFNAFQENTYIIEGCGKECIIVDPGAVSEDEQRRLLEALHGLTPAAVLLTHAHPDHIGAAGLLQKKFALKVYMHPADRDVPQHLAGPVFGNVDLSFVTTDVADGQKLLLAGLECEVIHTPGHSPGGVCYLFGDEDVIFTGDTLFRGCIGRSDLFGGEYDHLIVSIMDKIMGLPGRTEIFPGHAGSTTISEERTENPFLQPFNEPEECGIDGPNSI